MCIKKKFLSSLCAGFLLISIICAPISQTLTINHAEASGLPVFDGAGFIQTSWTAIKSTVSAAANYLTGASTEALAVKEYSLDAIAYVLINSVIEEMIKSVTAWVNNGFEGKPAFVQNLDKFLGNIGLQIAEGYIFGDENGDGPLSFLCSPFKLNIQLALQIQYAQSISGDGHSRAQCTLDQAKGNVENFLNGDFADGGWDRWFDITLNPSNNVYGAMFEAQAGLKTSLAYGGHKNTLELTFGDGFLSKKNPDGSITTPGSVINAQLNHALGLPADRLTTADEINELIGALLTQLAKGVLSEVGGGLSGLGDSNSDYWDQPNDLENGIGSPTMQLESDIKKETDYLNLLKEVTTRITAAEVACARDLPLSQSLKVDLAFAQTESLGTNALLAQLQSYKVEFAAVESAPEMQTLVQEYLSFRATLHTTSDVAELEVNLQDPGATNSDTWASLPDNIIAQIYLYNNQCSLGGRGN